MEYLSLFNLILAALLLILLVRTWVVEEGRMQKVFAKGKAPETMPAGFYKGSVHDVRLSWEGKKFLHDHRGVNVFKKGRKEVEKYPFKTGRGKGLRDEHMTVYKIDYNLRENPWWLRACLDEVVEVEPGKYLGKLHVRLVSWMPITLGYFWLKKA